MVISFVVTRWQYALVSSDLFITAQLVAPIIPLEVYLRFPGNHITWLNRLNPIITNGVNRGNKGPLTWLILIVPSPTSLETFHTSPVCGACYTQDMLLSDVLSLNLLVLKVVPGLLFSGSNFLSSCFVPFRISLRLDCKATCEKTGCSASLAPFCTKSTKSLKSYLPQYPLHFSTILFYSKGAVLPQHLEWQKRY